MSSTGSAGASHAERIARAAGLIRALSGVLEATVETDAAGIRSVAVVAEPDQGVWEVTRNVQSALLASLGLTIPTATVHVKLGPPVSGHAVLPSSDTANGRHTSQSNGAMPAAMSTPPAPAAGGADVAGNGGVPAGNGKTGKSRSAGGGSPSPEPSPSTRISAAAPAGPGAAEGRGSRLAPETVAVLSAEAPAEPSHEDVEGSSPRRKRALRTTAAAANGKAAENGAAPAAGETPPLRCFTTEGSAIAEVAVPREGKHVVAGGASIARLEFQAQPSGRIACRAVVASGDHIYAGQAAGADTPAGRLEAAARAVLAAALRPAELDGIKVVELAGRKYVIAAVRSWSGRETVYHADVAPVGASPEAAAARATLDAILQ